MDPTVHLPCAPISIDSLPAEILVEVLDLTREWDCWWTDSSEMLNDIIPSYGCLRNLSFAFTHVCQRWRHISHYTRPFWSTITGNHSSMDHLFDNLKRVGSGVSLNIRFVGPPYCKPGGSLGWLKPIAHRVRILSLEGHLTDFPTTSFGCLEILNASGVCLGMDYDTIFATNRLKAPNLRQVTVRRCFIDYFPLPFGKLTHMHLHECNIVPSALLDFLRKASSIQSLSVQTPIPFNERRAIDPNLMAHMPRLKNFALSGPLPWLVDHLKLPLLSNVMVMGPRAFEPNSYTDLASRSSAQLKSMIFKDGFIFEGQAMRLLNAISSLTEIAFSQTHSQMTQSFLMSLYNHSEDQSSLLLPNLELVTIVGCKGIKNVTTQQICRIVQSRDPSGNSPISLRRYGALARDIYTSSKPKRRFADESIDSTLCYDFLRRHKAEITQIFF